MAFFKFRKGSDEQAATAPQHESVDVLRRRAKNRLIGAVILVLIGVVGFPLLVDKQPRPVSTDIPIEIPDRSKVLPLSVPQTPAASVAPATSVTPVEAAADASAPAAKPAAAAPAKPQTKPAPKQPAAKPSTPPPAAKAAVKPVEKAEAGEHRYVIQVGAFADDDRARDTRLKLERAGIKSYTQVIETKEGRRIRVRAGPFDSKAEAERVAMRIHAMDMPATLLTL